MMRLSGILIGALEVAQLAGAHTPSVAGARVGSARLGAVASESSVCSRIGVDLLEAGGNAADAVCVCYCAVR